MLKIKKIKPLFNSLVTTMEMYSEDTIVGGVITKSSGGLKEYQKVIAVGDSIRNIQVGDLVCINPSRFAVKKYDANSIQNDLGNNKTITYNFNVIEIDEQQCLLLQDRDIDFVVSEFEETQDLIIKPEEPSIIV